MRAFSFDLIGELALFKKNDANDIVLISYNFIHKPALLGILGAIVGLSGYGNNRKEDSFALYYEKLKNLKIAIVPYYNKPLKKAIVDFNNASGLASDEKGAWQIREQILVGEPLIKYEVIILEDGDGEEKEYIDKLKDKISSKSSEFPLYFGKNEFFAWFENYREYEAKKREERSEELILDSLIKIDDFEESKRDEIDWFQIAPYYAIYEHLPYDFDESGLYKKATFVFSNKKFKRKPAGNIELYSINNENSGEKNVQFF